MIENPIQLTMVKAVPLVSGAVFFAIKVEKRGESPMTANPQILKKVINAVEGKSKMKGEIQQQIPEAIKK